MSLIAGSYYITIEQTLAPITRRPDVAAGWPMWLLAPVVIVLMPVAVVIHIAIWGIRQIGRMLVALGRWQTGRRWAPLAGLAGAVWLVAAVWILFACLDPQLGWRMIGR